MAAKRIKIDNASSKFRRQSQKREQKVIRCSVLIVCEGTKTEPNYFEAFAEKQQGVIVYDIEVKGLGRGTKDVVEKAIDLKNKNNYDRVWAVFDRDEFPAKDFNIIPIPSGSNTPNVFDVSPCGSPSNTSTLFPCSSPNI